jgi:DNA polymerase III epsilon subunit-like protein
VRISALHVEGEEVRQRFAVTLDPQRRVPRYVAARLRIESDSVEGQPAFADILDDLVRFLADRPVLAQDVQLTWSFLTAEARREGHVLLVPMLLDLNDLAMRLLDLKGKPSLSVVAAELGIGSVRIVHPDEEARVLALAGRRLLSMGGAQDTTRPVPTTLRRGATARSLPDEPGVYVLRDRDETALYVGKARRLRSRMAAYIHRPLGATRRLEGLVAAVDAVDSTRCATDLEALILEDREIRRLQPRFNTVRRQRTPRYWIRLPPRPEKGAPRRLELSVGASLDTDGQFVGPFRNQMLAQQARMLARDVFGLDGLRRADRERYEERLAEAWAFLEGDSARAQALTRPRSVHLLRQVVAFDVASLLLPADPRVARYAVIRAGPTSIEGLLLDRAILYAWGELADTDESFVFAQHLLAPCSARTTPEEVDVVLRWFGAQRPPARLVLLPDDALAAADAIEDAVLGLVAREA